MSAEEGLISRRPFEVATIWLAGLGPASRRTYAGALRDFARVLGCDVAAACGHLLTLGVGTANMLAASYRAVLQAEGRAPATICVRLSALRGLVDHARRAGVVAWALEVDAPRCIPYRDTRGPGEEGVLMVLRAASRGVAASRDLAILWMLYGLALRRAEVVGLDLADVELGLAVVWVAGKGDGGQRLPTSLPPPAAAALAGWIRERGDRPGPLFVSRARSLRGALARLTVEGVDDVVRRLGASVGLILSPHRLRHAAITVALEVTGGDLPSVQAFSRHRDVRTVQIYDDRRRDPGGRVAAMVAARADLRLGAAGDAPDNADFRAHAPSRNDGGSE